MDFNPNEVTANDTNNATGQENGQVAFQPAFQPTQTVAPTDPSRTIAPTQVVQPVAAAAATFNVKTSDGKSIQINYDTTMTIATIKDEVMKKQNIPVAQQRLIFNGKQLEDQYTVADYNINPDDVIHLVLRLRGGA